MSDVGTTTLREVEASLTDDQRGLLRLFAERLLVYNGRINLISRRHTAEDVEKRHIRHSLTLATVLPASGVRVADFGAGGGLPCIPLAIACPAVEFVALESVGKKVAALRAMVRELGLENVQVEQMDARLWRGPHDISVSRATAELRTLWKWHIGGSSSRSCECPLLCLKGGDLSDEVGRLERAYAGVGVSLTPLEAIDPSPEFQGKILVRVRAES